MDASRLAVMLSDFAQRSKSQTFDAKPVIAQECGPYDEFFGTLELSDALRQLEDAYESEPLWQARCDLLSALAAASFVLKEPLAGELQVACLPSTEHMGDSNHVAVILYVKLENNGTTWLFSTDQRAMWAAKPKFDRLDPAKRVPVPAKLIESIVAMPPSEHAERGYLNGIGDPDLPSARPAPLRRASPVGARATHQEVGCGSVGASQPRLRAQNVYERRHERQRNVYEHEHGG